MKITRSSFLATAATAAAALVLRPHDLAAALAARDEGQLDLRSSVGETFHARSESGALVTLRLERVDELRSDTTIEQFRLVFSGDERLPLALPGRLLSPRGPGPGEPAPLTAAQKGRTAKTEPSERST